MASTPPTTNFDKVCYYREQLRLLSNSLSERGFGHLEDSVKENQLDLGLAEPAVLDHSDSAVEWYEQLYWALSSAETECSDVWL